MILKINYFIIICLLTGTNSMAKEKYPSLSEEALKGRLRTNLDSPNPTKEQLERKTKYTEHIKNLNLPVTDSLPVIEDSKLIIPRSAEEIAKRAIAVAITAVKGEGMPHNEVMDIVTQWDVISYFSPDELQYINNPNVTEEERLKFSWRYEGLDILLWALGYKENIPPPNQICDVATDVSLIVNNKDKLLIKNSRLRNINEILDMADFYYRLHWSAIELRLNEKESEIIDEEIIMERHYALNWLIKYMNQEWDDISTDT